MGEIDSIIQATSPEKMPLAGQHPDAAYVGRIRSLDSCSEVDTQIIATGCFWDRDGSHIDTWTRAISRLAIRVHQDGGTMSMLFLSKEPARLLLYAMGIAFAANVQWDCIYSVLADSKSHSPFRKDSSLAHYFQDDTFHPDVYKKLPNFERRITPISDHMFDALRPVFQELLPHDRDYSDAFDTFEILQSLWFVEEVDPVGWTLDRDS